MKKKLSYFIITLILISITNLMANSTTISDIPELPKKNEFIINLVITNEFVIDTINKSSRNIKMKSPFSIVKIKYNSRLGYRLFEPEPDPILLKLKKYFFKIVFETGGDPITYIEIYKHKNKLMFNWIQPGKIITIFNGEVNFEMK